MKKFLVILAMVGFIGALAASKASAYDDSYRKLKRGAINVVSSPLEIPKNIVDEVKKDEVKPLLKPFAALGGLFKGAVFMLGRMGSGFWDMATFNVEKIKTKESLVQPDYINGKSEFTASSTVVEDARAEISTETK